MVISGGGVWIDMAVACSSTMAIATMNTNAPPVLKLAALIVEPVAQNGGSSVSGSGSDWIMLCSQSSS